MQLASPYRRHGSPPMSHRLRIAALASLLLTALGCGASASVQNAGRAQKEYELAVGLVGERNVAGAFEHLFTAVELDPKNAEAHLLLGNLYMFRGDFPEAERYMRAALKIAQNDERYGEPMVAEVQNALGVVLVHEERYDEAIEMLRASATSLLNRHPHLSWGNLGWAYYETGDYEQALIALSQSVRQEPGFCLGFYRLGKTHWKLRNLEEAEAALTRALETDDPACRGLQDGWRLRGEARAQLGLREDAISDFERCVEIAAENEVGRTCQGFLEATH